MKVQVNFVTVGRNDAFSRYLNVIKMRHNLEQRGMGLSFNSLKGHAIVKALRIGGISSQRIKPRAKTTRKFDDVSNSRVGANVCFETSCIIT